MSIVIFDMDGTLADISHRRHHVVGDVRDWKSFNAKMEYDAPNWPIANLARTLHEAGKTIIICTGRFEMYRALTEHWLEKWRIKYDDLLMRPDDDYDSDHIVKLAMLNKIKSETSNPILFSVDDRNSVVAMWREQGVTCLQCAEGDF